MCDLLDDPCALVSGPRKSQQGESLGMQLGELAKLIVVFIYLACVTVVHYHTIISIPIHASYFICYLRYTVLPTHSVIH
jgi:hypothetical protein